MRNPMVCEFFVPRAILCKKIFANVQKKGLAQKICTPSDSPSKIRVFSTKNYHDPFYT